MQAARTRFLAAVLLLVGSGADVGIRDIKSRTIFDLNCSSQQLLQAIEQGQRELRRRYLTELSRDSSIEAFSPEILSTITEFLVSTNILHSHKPVVCCD